jgi:CO/xanthine dehydrogenase Mo-binding subunit
MGQPINPKFCESQMEGGLGMGIGGALYEEMTRENGVVVNPTFMDYKLPSSMDVPPCRDVKSMIAAAPHREGPFGAKGFSKGGVVAVAPAIANAIHNATGVRIRDLPITKEKVLKITTAHDCDRAINPMSVEGQIDGSMHMAIGYSLSEDLITEKGKILNPSFLDYKILSASDMPESESIVVETDDPIGPFGAKEAEEGLTVPTAPAIADAVYDAIGVRIKDLPLTPEKILRALKEKKEVSRERQLGQRR